MNHYHDITPLRAYHPLLRLDTLPFIIVYTILILVDNLSGPTSTARLQHWNTLLLFPLTLFIHITLFVWTRWNIRIEALVGYKTVERNDFHAWTHCLVIPPNPTISKVNKASNSSASVVGRSEIIPVQIKCVPQTSQGLNTSKQIDGSASLDRWVATISYEEMVFRCCFDDANNNNNDDDDDDINNRDDEMDGIWTKNSNTEIGSSTKSSPPKSQIIDRTNAKSSTSSSSSSSSMFHKLRYPSNLPLSFYTQQWIGHTTKQSIQRTINVYSNNNLNINLPPFLDLLTQQLLAPFFLFQLFCVLLWCLDEYWYYALFTLFTLVLFECTVAYTRLKNLLRLRETLRTPFAVWTYRCSKWEQISTNDLIVGDVISLSSSLTTSAHHDGVHIPADLLLMKGSAVVNEAMLTGESVPQIKESIDGVASTLSGGGIRDENKLDIDDSTYKRSILFGGTVLVNHSNQSSASSPPGCIAMVLRTGFDTQQGSLLRTMIHTSTKAQSDGVNTKDTFLFILILLLCAVFSSLVVLKHGWNDPTRNRFKLILHVIIIITSVVPPELPMELSLAVTSSLADLITRCSVYCTEPFRIPLAGMVDTCAFDKTGTLTSDEMVLRGVRLVINGNKGDVDISESLVLPPRESDDDDDDNDGDKDGNGNGSNETIPPNVMRVMVGCQSLASLSGYNQTLNATSTNLIGDPLEKAVLEGCGWTLLSNTTVAPPQKLLSSSMGMINIQHRFAFTSKLKRMTVIATDLGNKKNLALTKGAPETLKEFFDASSLPESYDSVSRYHMSLGQRVLAMGYKELSSKVTVASWKKRGREEVESNLIFAGFLILDCPLKPDSRKVIKELRRSGHDVVMITGDAILTAAEVARQVGIIDKSSKADTYELRDIRQDDSNAIGAKFAFVPINTIDKNIASIDKQIAYSLPNLEVVKNMLASSEIRAICVSGDALNKLAMEAVRLKGHADTIIDVKSVLLHPDAQTTLQEIVPIVSVFARHAPRQKEAVIAAFNGAGRYTLMCGDGTNDVGALKMSHVGISIISVPDVEAKERKALKGLSKIRGHDQNVSKKKKKSRKKAWNEHVKELAEAEEELNNVALGDASVASPFTSRVTSIRCTKDVLQRGRCTLITMLQIYKILGVNCLVNALVLSNLHLVGAKQGDAQLTAVGLVVAGLFFFVTKGKPLEKLSKKRPPSSILSFQAITSIAVQFAVHFVCIMAVTGISTLYLDPKYDPSLVPDGAFNPNTLNTATFLITVQATVSTFVVNYRGRPFMEDLHENKLMVRGLQVAYGVLFTAALEVFPPINDLLQLAPLPTILPSVLNDEGLALHMQLLFTMLSSIGFKSCLCIFMILDTLIAYAFEKMLIRFIEK